MIGVYSNERRVTALPASRRVRREFDRRLATDGVFRRDEKQTRRSDETRYVKYFTLSRGRRGIPFAARFSPRGRERWGECVSPFLLSFSLFFFPFFRRDVNTLRQRRKGLLYETDPSRRPPPSRGYLFLLVVFRVPHGFATPVFIC